MAWSWHGLGFPFGWNYDGSLAYFSSMAVWSIYWMKQERFRSGHDPHSGLCGFVDDYCWGGSFFSMNNKTMSQVLRMPAMRSKMLAHANPLRTRPVPRSSPVPVPT